MSKIKIKTKKEIIFLRGFLVFFMFLNMLIIFFISVLFMLR